ncbi:MAG: hypothetical protein V7679_16105 [Parasphingorhabdus sp.]
MSSTDEQSKFLTEQLRKWDRTLLVVSIPHGAAFGAFVGNYEFTSGGENAEKQFLTMFFLILMLPLTSCWLYFLYDQLRNTFLRTGHMGKFLKFKHTAIYSAVFSFPVAVILAAANFKDHVAAEVFGLIGVILVSWMGCAVLSAGNIYITIIRELGIKTNV